MKSAVWLRARTIEHTDGSLWVTLDDALEAIDQTDAPPRYPNWRTMVRDYSSTGLSFVCDLCSWGRDASHSLRELEEHLSMTHHI